MRKRIAIRQDASICYITSSNTTSFKWTHFKEAQNPGIKVASADAAINISLIVIIFIVVKLGEGAGGAPVSCNSPSVHCQLSRLPVIVLIATCRYTTLLLSFCIRCRLYTEYNREGHPLPKVPGESKVVCSNSKKAALLVMEGFPSWLGKFRPVCAMWIGLVWGWGALCCWCKAWRVWVTDAGRLYQTLAIPSHPSASPKGSRGASQRSVRPRFMGQILPQSAPAFSHEGGWG